MTAALTIAVLLALSATIVRFASVALRQTGLPDSVARFQSISALSGTGFTTREAELIVNYPIRRKIVTGLMLLGNLGLASVAATFIVAFVGAGMDADAVLLQMFAFAFAIAMTWLVLANKTVDRLSCALISHILNRTVTFKSRRYVRVYQLEDGYSIAEHTFAGPDPISLSELADRANGLTPLAVRGGSARAVCNPTGDRRVAPGDAIFFFGSDEAHENYGSCNADAERKETRGGEAAG